jgi:DNA-binding GntR family transcriptional regulator
MSASTVSATAIELLQSHSLTTLVQRELERRIVSGEIAPGEKLNEVDVAGELNVSRGPVREAFRALEQAGLVRTEKNRGVFVRELSVQEADEIYEMRAGLDELIGRLAAERVTRPQVDQLRDLRFHDLLAQFAGNGTLLAAYRRLVNELHLFRRETLAHGADSFPISTREHSEIVDALARGDADQASRLLYRHAMESRDRLHATLERPTAAKRARRTAR